MIAYVQTRTIIIFLFVRGWGLESNRPVVSAPDDYVDGEIGGMIDRGNRSTRRKPAQLLLCLPQTLHATRTRTRDAAVGSQRLTA
jgi:hypothetical protein